MGQGRGLGRLAMLQITEVRIDGGTQPRVEIDEAAVAEYAEAMAEEACLPAVEVVYDGSDYWLWDGFHRYHAHVKAGYTIIRANVTQGSREYAVWLATGANREHGIRRRNVDKWRAVEMALLVKPDASSSAIAEHVGVSDPFVEKVRAEVLTVRTSAGDEPAKRVGKDGKSYPSKRKPKGDKKPAPAAEAKDDEQVSSGDTCDADGEPQPDATAGQTSASPVDPAGLPIPDELRAVFGAGARFDDLARLIRQTQRLAHELAESPGGELYRANLGHRGKSDDGLRHYCEHLKNAMAKVDHCRPFASACPYCEGKRDRGCKGCAGRGWVNKACWESAPADYRDAVALASGAGEGEP